LKLLNPNFADFALTAAFGAEKIMLLLTQNYHNNCTNLWRNCTNQFRTAQFAYNCTVKKPPTKCKHLKSLLRCGGR